MKLKKFTLTKTRKLTFAIIASLIVFVLAIGLIIAKPFAEKAPLPPRQFTNVQVAAVGPAFSENLGPDQIVIPAINAQGFLRPSHVALDTGVFDVPNDPRVVGLADNGPTLSSPTGTVLLAGHVNLDGAQGTLADLAHVEAGNRIITTDGAAVRQEWIIDSLTATDKDKLPENLVTDNGPKRLTIVTCGGLVHRDGQGRGTYDKNVIVGAHLAQDDA